MRSLTQIVNNILGLLLVKSFDFEPKILAITGINHLTNESYHTSFFYLSNFYTVLVDTSMITNEYQCGDKRLGLGSNTSNLQFKQWIKKSLDGRTISWYIEDENPNADQSPTADNQFNHRTVPYHYFCLG